MSIRDDFFAAKAQASLWDVAVSIKRGNPLPLDADSIFESYAALEAYAADVLAYPGQLVAVVEENATAIYYLDQELAIKPVGIIPTGDDKTIEVSAEGMISLLGAADAANGTLPMIGEEGKIVWKTLEDIGAGDGNDNTTYDITALEKGEEDAKETYGIQIQVKENGVAAGDPIVIDFDVYTKSEADTLIEALSTRIQTLEEKEDKDTTYSVKDGEKILKLEGTEFSTVASLKYVPASETDTAKIQLLGIDNTLVSEIDATPFIKDGMLHDVDYDPETNKLTFTWNTDAGEKSDEVILSDIIEAYTGGNGLHLAGNEFSIKIHTGSENFLSVDADGLKLSGVQDAIDAAEGRAAEDAQSKADAALESAKADAADLYATKAYVGTIPDSYEQTNVISYINKKAEEVLSAAQGGSSETAASVKQQLDNYKSENDTKVNANTTAITNINTKLETIEENAEVNIIEEVKVNGTALTVSDKAVNIEVPTNLNQLEGYASIDERITTAKSQADKGVEEAGKAQAAATTNAEAIAGHKTRIETLESAKTAHENRLILLENADTDHAAEFNTLKGIVEGHTGAIAGKAEQTTVAEIAGKVATNETEIKAIKEVSIPAVYEEIGKKANASEVYTKTEVGTIENGKTIVQMIADAKSEATYDDTAVKGLISAEETRAKGIEQGLDGRLTTVETFFKAVETPDETIDTLAEIVSYIESDKSGASAMAGNIKKNTDDIAAILHEETGILALAENYADAKIAAIPAATAETLGLVKYDNDSIKMNESNQLYVAKVSTDLLTQGSTILILNGGSATD